MGTTVTPAPCALRAITDLDVARAREQEASTSVEADQKTYDAAVAKYRNEVPFIDRALSSAEEKADYVTRSIITLNPMDALYWRQQYNVASVTWDLAVRPLENKLNADTRLRDFWRREVARDKRAVVGTAAKSECPSTATADNVMRESKAWADVLAANAKGPVLDSYKDPKTGEQTPTSPELLKYRETAKDIPHASQAIGAEPLHVFSHGEAFGYRWSSHMKPGETWDRGDGSFIEEYSKTLNTNRQPL